MERDHKMVILMRKDVKMTKGKIAAQASHGTLMNYITFVNSKEKRIRDYFDNWLEHSQTKIVLGCYSEAEMLEVYEKAKVLGIPASIVCDAGYTVFNGVPTNTCIAIGPAQNDEIDDLTRDFPLL